MVLEFDEIISIEDIGIQDFYDIEVPETQCYFAQNILHHNSGKDRTIAKLFAYLMVKLLHMRNPQEGFNYFMGGGLGIDAQIDIINVSKDGGQAKKVFFANLKAVLKKITNPTTGKNFFEENGVDLRDTKDIQTNTIILPHNVTCHSLNSKEYAGEGLTTLIAMGDEIGSFPSYTKVDEQLTSIRETIDSRFPKIGKLMLISFQYNLNCPMTIEYKKGLNDPRIFSSTGCTWEINPTKTKQNFARRFQKNPDKSKMTYMCKGESSGGGYIKNKKVIYSCIAPGHKESPGEGENPTIGKIVTTSNLRSLRFESWFKGVEGKIYTAHFDLAKARQGKNASDSAGFVLAHAERLLPRIHESVVEELHEMGIFVSETPTPQRGIIIDFATQLLAPSGQELILADARKFILMLKNILKFNIKFVSFDRWQSLDNIQQLSIMGIDAFEQSVDRTEIPYQTVKELLYQGLIRGYENPILNRELSELIKDEKGKVDHPEKSYDRFEQEGREDGSKDVADCLAGATYSAMTKIQLESGFSFG